MSDVFSGLDLIDTYGTTPTVSRSSIVKPSTSSFARTESIPLHVQLSDILREKVYSREWTPGRRIPSEHELMDSFDLSRGTVRRAIKSLVEEGLLTQVRGSGTFVAEAGISHPAGERPISFAASLHEQGKDFVTHVLVKQRLAAPPEVVSMLELRPGDQVMYLRRVRTVDGEPIMCQEGWNSLRECPGLFDVDFTKEPAFDAVEHCAGRKIKSARMRYVARVAGKEHGDYLGCEESSPVLLLEQVIRLDDETPIEWSFTWLKAGQEVVGTAVQPS